MSPKSFSRWLKTFFGSVNSQKSASCGKRLPRKVRRWVPFLEPLESRDLFSANPFVLSINRATPASATVSASSVSYAVTFSKAVTGVDPTDFTLALTGGVTGPFAVSSWVGWAPVGWPSFLDLRRIVLPSVKQQTALEA
jgi:hypothetical protein